MKQKTDNRKMLLTLTKGGIERYYIMYSVDIKGNITIWEGEAMGMDIPHDMFMSKSTEDYLHLYDGWNRGAELIRMEKEAAENVTREQLIAAYLEFRKQHPNDGWGWIQAYKKKEAHAPDDGKRMERDDKEEVKRELRRRNRQYIAELYGEELPVDFDFHADYEARLEARSKQR